MLQIKKFVVAGSMSTLMLVGLSQPSVMAQDTVPENQPGQDQPGSTVAPREFDWRWLIPVIGIPLLLYALTRSRDTTQDRTYGDNRMAGTRGGESSRSRRRDSSIE